MTTFQRVMSMTKYPSYDRYQALNVDWNVKTKIENPAQTSILHKIYIRTIEQLLSLLLKLVDSIYCLKALN